MLIPSLPLTPGLADALRRCGDEPLDVEPAPMNEAEAARRAAREETVGWDESPRGRPMWYAMRHDSSGAVRASRPLGPRCECRHTRLCHRHQWWPEDGDAVLVAHHDGSELAEHERIRVDGIIAAHKAEPL